jgi:lipase chaperone LimK
MQAFGRIGWILALLVLAGASAAVVIWYSGSTAGDAVLDQAPPSPTLAASKSPSAVAGRVSAPAASEGGQRLPLPAPSPLATLTEPPMQVTLDAQQKLVITPTLLHIFHFYLLTGQEGGREQHLTQLRDYLQRKLPAPAVAQALELVGQYARYMQEHDELLARQQLVVPTTDAVPELPFIERIATWHEQRSRLRQSILGRQTSKIWFAEQENGAQQVIDGLRQKVAQANAPAAPDDQAALREQRTHGEARARQLAQDAYQFAQQSTRSFIAIEQDEQQFNQHFAQYEKAVAQLGELEPAIRATKLDAMRPQFLPTLAEQEHARALGK